MMLSDSNAAAAAPSHRVGGLAPLSGMGNVPHITVCVCTYKRPHLLKRLLAAIQGQTTGGSFTYSVVVADNDVEMSAKTVVDEFHASSDVRIDYCVEPEQNIALVRNRAVSRASGDFIAFIDDDEYPEPAWLQKLLETLTSFQADGVLGPVLPDYEEPPPAWVLKGRFCERPAHSTGFIIGATEGRTGNLLLKRRLLQEDTPVFRPEFGSGGEDADFFRRMTARRKVFVWCNEAPVYERIPPGRLKRGVMLRRALLRGKMATQHRADFLDTAKSLIAVIVYVMALPVLLLVGQQYFMKVLIKTFDHAGKLLALLRIDLVREKYVTE